MNEWVYDNKWLTLSDSCTYKVMNEIRPQSLTTCNTVLSSGNDKPSVSIVMYIQFQKKKCLYWY